MVSKPHASLTVTVSRERNGVIALCKGSEVTNVTMPLKCLKTHAANGSACDGYFCAMGPGRWRWERRRTVQAKQRILDLVSVGSRQRCCHVAEVRGTLIRMRRGGRALRHPRHGLRLAERCRRSGWSLWKRSPGRVRTYFLIHINNAFIG